MRVIKDMICTPSLLDTCRLVVGVCLVLSYLALLLGPGFLLAGLVWRVEVSVLVCRVHLVFDLLLILLALSVKAF